MINLSRWYHHWRRGGWRHAWRRRGQRLKALRKVRWQGTDSPQLAADALAYRAEAQLGEPPGWVLLLAEESDTTMPVQRSLKGAGLRFRVLNLPQALALTPAECHELRCIVSGFPDARRTTLAADALLASEALSPIPFEYVVGLEPERQIFDQLDEYPHARFASPTMLGEIAVHEIYARSLQRFEQKCGFRDYLDLYQCLRSVVERQLPGDIAEFGSYQGHSGYLLASLLRQLGCERELYLFDTFDCFPTESLGVDRFWSGTHEVSFEAVKAKFSEFDSVHFERGEFGTTFDQSRLGPIALAYVDCDSYRAVRYLAERIWNERLVEGGIMVFEDYGHPALLGCRQAIHGFFDDRKDCIRWYSHFSGLYIAVKTGAP